MAYDIHIHENDIVFIRFHGLSDLKENKKAREEVLKICQDSGITLILSDWRKGYKSQSVSTADLYDFGNTWHDDKACMFYYIAIVQPKDETTRRDIEFASTVAHNRFLNCRLFNDTNEAISWLRSNIRS